jgi:hypothetical protein
MTFPPEASRHAFEPGAALSPEDLAHREPRRWEHPVGEFPGPLHLEFPGDWPPEKIEAFEAEFDAFMRSDLARTHAIRLLPPGKPVSPVTHIAGSQVQVGSCLRQRCSWCGAILADYDLTRIAVPEGQDPRPGMWATGKLVRVDGLLSVIVEHEDGADLPDDACAVTEIGR